MKGSQWGTVCALVAVAALGLFALAACGGTPAAAPVTLTAGQFTPFGVNPRNNQPTPSDAAEMQAAVNGMLDEPALVEFYSDY